MKYTSNYILKSVKSDQKLQILEEFFPDSLPRPDSRGSDNSPLPRKSGPVSPRGQRVSILGPRETGALWVVFRAFREVSRTFWEPHAGIWDVL